MKIGNGNPVMMALVAAFALGAGVMGTLTYMESRRPASNSQSTAVVPVAPPSSPVAPSAFPSQPSIAGLTPGQAALTLGNWHYDSQQWPQAIEKYRVALASGLDIPDVRTDLGNAFRFAGQPQKALEQYKIAQKQDPNHEQSLYNQGGLWAFSFNNKAKAIEAWRIYLKRFPQGQSADAARQLIAQHSKK